MTSSIIKIKVKKFRPIGSLSTTTVEMELMSPIAGSNPPSDGHVTLLGAYHLKQRKQPEPSMVKFFLETDPSDADRAEMMRRRGGELLEEYLILGIAFSNRIQNSDPERLGQHRFDRVSIATENLEIESGNKPVRVLSVTNNQRHLIRESYDYLILIQRVDDGAFGIIDPEYENET